MTSVEHDFQVWVRTDGHNTNRYQIKYTVGRGKGLFRIEQHSGIISTPASNADVIPALSRDEVAHSTLVISDNGRHTYPFAENTVKRLEDTNVQEWVLVEVNESRQLEIHAPAPNIDTRVDEAKTPTKNHSNGMTDDHIRYLESELLRTKKHVQKLKNRVAELEEQIVDLGGELRPLILK